MQTPEGSNEATASPTRQVIDWAGGSLDDLVALLSGPASSARIEVLVAGKVLGEVHVIAGGVSEALFEGKSTHDALDKLRALKGSEFRVEPRMPNPANGDLAAPGPDQGKLEERPLATLMRYCEEFVLTANIEVWRASESAKVEYKRGEIVGVTVGGIDAPERLSEVMKWASGSYRLVVPKLSLPAVAPKAPAPAVVAPRSAGATSKTIFGMPALDPAAIAAAAEKARLSRSTSTVAAAAPGVPPTTTAAPAPAQVRATPSRPVVPGATMAPPAVTTPSKPVTINPPAPAPSAAAPATVTPPPQAARTNTNRTIFGVAAPATTAPAGPVTPAAPAATAATPPPSAAAATTPVLPASPGPAASAGRPSAASRPTTAQPIQASSKGASAGGGADKDKDKDKAHERGGKSKGAAAPVAATDDATIPTKAPKTEARGTPVWTFVAIGFAFGLALLGIYRVVMTLSN